MDKEILRSSMLRSLSSLSDEEIQKTSFALTNQIIKFMNVYTELGNQVGAGYMPLKSEVAPVYQMLLQAVPLVIAYPILKNGLMSFAIPEGLPKGGIWLDKPYHEVEPSWLFVPGLAFGLEGQRLGRGKGYYDRYLENSKAIRIALAWSQQIQKNIPVESHDCHMDFIITDNFCWDVKQQNKF